MSVSKNGGVNVHLVGANSDRDDPDSRYRIYEQLRTPSGVVQDGNLTVVTSFARAQEVLHQPDVYGSNVLEIQADVLLTKVVKRLLTNPIVGRLVDPIPVMMNEPLIFQNGERHRRGRSAIAPSLRPALIEPMRQRFQDIAYALFAAKSRDGRFDVVSDFAAPLGVRVTLGLFGVGSEHDRWVHRQLQSTVAAGRGANFMGGLAGAPLMAITQKRLRSFFFEKVLTASEGPDTPLLSAVKKRSLDDGDDVAMAEFIQLLVGGTETSQNLVVNGVWRLLRDPSARAALISGRTSLSAFRQEVLRHDSPSQVIFRLTNSDVQLGDVVVAKGHRVAIVIGAANRDPAVFVDPAYFDVRRFDADGRPHGGRAAQPPLSFGDGVHACPGYFVAGNEADVAWTVLLDNARNLRIDAPALRTESGIAANGLERLPVAFDPTDLGYGASDALQLGL